MKRSYGARLQEAQAEAAAALSLHLNFGEDWEAFTAAYVANKMDENDYE